MEQKLSVAEGYPMTDIKEPHRENDILFGRGGGTNHHPGNIRYRQIVEDKKLEYFTSTRREKGAMAREIVRAWRDQNPPGRFLIKDELVTGLWEDVGDKKAREKISQALREKGPEFRRQNDMDDTSKPNKPRIGEVKKTVSPSPKHTREDLNAVSAGIDTSNSSDLDPDALFSDDDTIEPDPSAMKKGFSHLTLPSVGHQLGFGASTQFTERRPSQPDDSNLTDEFAPIIDFGPSDDASWGTVDSNVLDVLDGDLEEEERMMQQSQAPAMPSKTHLPKAVSLRDQESDSGNALTKRVPSFFTDGYTETSTHSPANTSERKRIAVNRDNSATSNALKAKYTPELLLQRSGHVKREVSLQDMELLKESMRTSSIGPASAGQNLERKNTMEMFAEQLSSHQSEYPSTSDVDTSAVPMKAKYAPQALQRRSAVVKSPETDLHDESLLVDAEDRKTSLEMFAEYMASEPSRILPSNPSRAVERNDTMDSFLAALLSQAKEDVSDAHRNIPEDFGNQIEHPVQQPPKIRTKGGYSPEEYFGIMNEPLTPEFNLEK